MTDQHRITSSASRPPVRALPALTSLRFPAALAILIHHCNGVFWPTAELGPLDAGVSFFFVLSGYILTHVYGCSVADRAALRRFHLARIARIWPLHIACLIATMLLLAVPEPFRAGALAGNALLLHAWIPFDRYFFSYNYVSWSISTELFFYIAFPWLVRRSRAALVAWLCVALSTVAMLVLVSYEDALPSWNTAYDRLSSTGLLYTNPLARIAEFMLGIVAARFAGRKEAGPANASSIAPAASAASITGSVTVSVLASTATVAWRWTLFEIAAIAWFIVGFGTFRISAAFFTREVATFAGAIGIPAVAGALPGQAVAAIGTEWLGHVGLAPFAMILILVFAQQRGRLSQWLSHRWLVFLGEASFALYLVHQIGLRLLQQQGLAPLPATELHLVEFAGYLGAMLVAAALLHVLVERPARRWIVRRTNPVVAVAVEVKRAA